ncbi:MAG: ankyrin repeat domain-containing protein [Gammaproteobacteria bacterium]
MFQLIKTQDLKGLQEKLAKIREMPSIKNQMAKLAVRNNAGQTLLHAAVEKNSIAMVQELLAMDINLKDVDREGKTALALAKELGQRDMICLLNTRQYLQASIGSFKFNYTMRLIEKIFTEIQSANKEDKVLFIGATGTGKSTLLNYLNGTRYNIYTDGLLSTAKPVGGVKEIALTGQNSAESQTRYPQLLKNPELDFVYCDLAGLFDSRGIEERICAAVSAHLLSKMQGGIRGIMVFLDIPGFNSKKGEAFKDTALALAKTINGDIKLMDSVHFVITKTPYDGMLPLTVENIIAEINKLLDTIDEDDEPALYTLLKTITEKPENIIIPDICDNSISKRLIDAKFKQLSTMDATLFNFFSYEETQRSFNAALLNIAKSFIEKKQNIEKHLPTMIAELQKAQELALVKINAWESEIIAINEELIIQQKIDKMVEIWVQIGEETNNTRLNQLLKDSHDLFAEISACYAQKKIPTTILKTQLAKRRWYLPWNKDPSGRYVDGPHMLLQQKITKINQLILAAKSCYQDLCKTEQNCQNSISDLHLEIASLQSIFKTGYKLIKSFELKEDDFLAFEKAYDEYYVTYNDHDNRSTAMHFAYNVTYSRSKCASAAGANQSAGIDIGDITYNYSKLKL